MANSKARSTSRSARTVTAVSATPTSRKVTRPAVKAVDEELLAADEFDDYEEAAPRTGPPLWLQLVSFVLAIVGLAISAYETWAHYHGSHLAGCSTKPGTFDCTAVITSPQSMVFGVIPVAVLGLAFYVAAVPLFSPWLWNLKWRLVGLVRLVSVVVGMGFVLYLIYVELVQVKQVCEYCSGVHLVTFLLFCITVFGAALWGLGPQRETARD